MNRQDWMIGIKHQAHVTKEQLRDYINEFVKAANVKDYEVPDILIEQAIKRGMNDPFMEWVFRIDVEKHMSFQSFDQMLAGLEQQSQQTIDAIQKTRELRVQQK